jgi:hypothetical protein
MSTDVTSSLQVPIATVQPTATAIQSVVEMTKSVFGPQSNVRFIEKRDPEMPGESYVMIYVTSRLSDKEILRNEDQWHRLLRGVACGLHHCFSICIDSP